ncbi:MAG: hypothetical protein H6732_06920 [Alphaproteobacteria bacterium]|nr:hypothetical protein [Alphaproteobacteria bacterium]
MHPLSAAVADLFEALARHGRAVTRSDEDQRRQLATEVGGHVAHVVSVAEQGPAPAKDEPPPRAVALAMARALFGSPHLSQTLSVFTTASEYRVFVPSPQLADALGLAPWELEELRNDLDVEVAAFLKQSRALHWLWSKGGNPKIAPAPLWTLLFPGSVQPQAERFAYRGGRLYALVDQPAPPPVEALYLPWLPGSERWTAVPTTHFAARYLDPSLVRSLSRAIGGPEAEIVDLLDEVVCVVPADDEQAFLLKDRWRSEGWSAVTGIGRAHPTPAWLTLRLAPDAIEPDGWLEKQGDGLALKTPTRVFDRHAMGRIATMMNGIYGEICARTLTREKIDAHRQSVLFDLDPYIQRVLQPLLDWAVDPRTHRHLAGRMGVEPEHVGAAMAQVRDGWARAAATSWGGVPTEERPFTVQSILAAHLAVSQASLHRLFHAEDDPRAPHSRILLLFVAHYLKDAPLGRLWKTVDGKLPPPEDVVGQWFWPLWLRVLDAIDATESP